MRKFENWVATYTGAIGLIIFVLGYTTLVFFLGMIYEWDNYGRVKEVEIQTKILEYRLGDLTLGRDTINVIKEAPYNK